MHHPAGRTHDVGESFLAIPHQTLADAALTRGGQLGAEHVDVRVEDIRSAGFDLRDGAVEGSTDTADVGLAVRVVHDGAWGFAAGAHLTPAEAVRLVEDAVAMARLSRSLGEERVELAPEPVVPDGRWVSPYEVDPFDVPAGERIALLADRSDRLQAAGVTHVLAHLGHVLEQTSYADSAGTRTVQQRVRVHTWLEGVQVDPAEGRAETMRTLAGPAGRGWEYVTGADGVHDWDAELAELPDLLAQKLAAPSVQPGDYDLVIDPTNLWLTIHESVGHATELDRALGYEANYAGTSFATPDHLGTLRYGSPAMHVTGDRTQPHGLATVGWDHEGVAAQQFDLVRDGTLVGYQTDRRIAHLMRDTLGSDRSNGCAFADSPMHVPIQRMANVSLAAAADGPSTADLIAGVERGLYVVGDKSWSIDMQRYNFQFTGQRFFRIEHGRLVGQVRDVAYQSTTLDFWNALAAVGGPQTWVLGGAMNCGKAQPGQVAPVSHGCPATLFTGVRILNTAAEGGR
jgi:TldD protein